MTKKEENQQSLNINFKIKARKSSAFWLQSIIKNEYRKKSNIRSKIFKQAY